jgi:hypothetical protein
MANTCSYPSGESSWIGNHGLAVELGHGHGDRSTASTAAPALRSAYLRLHFLQS